MKNKYVLGLGLILAVAVCATQTRSQTNAPNPPQQNGEIFIKVNSEEYNKRFKALNAEPAILLNSLAERYKDRKAELEKNALWLAIGTMKFLCVSNTFWKDGRIQENLVKDYSARIKLVPRATENDWTVALLELLEPKGSKIATKAELSQGTMIVLGVVILQDRLFDDNVFKEEKSKRLLTRLKSVPRDSLDRWAEGRQLDDYQAAVSLINMDSLFDKDVFRSELFMKKLEEIGKKPEQPAGPLSPSTEPSPPPKPDAPEPKAAANNDQTEALIGELSEIVVSLLDASYLKGDKKFVGSLLADEFTFTTKAKFGFGVNRSWKGDKAKFVRDVRRDKTVTAVRCGDYVLKMEGEVAVLSGVCQIAVDSQSIVWQRGFEPDVRHAFGREEFKHSFVKRGGKWLIVSAQTLSIPPRLSM